MNIIKDAERYILHRNNGEVVVLSYEESHLIYRAMKLDMLWEEIVFQYEDDDCWNDIAEAKEDILSDIEYAQLDNSNDEVFSNIVERYIN